MNSAHHNSIPSSEEELFEAIDREAASAGLTEPETFDIGVSVGYCIRTSGLCFWQLWAMARGEIRSAVNRKLAA